MPTPRERLNELRALSGQQQPQQVTSPRERLDELRSQAQQPKIAPPPIEAPVDSRTLAFKPSGEALTPEMRREEAGIVPDTDLPLSQVPLEAIKNLPESAVEFGKAVAQPILHPIETAKSVGTLAKGVFEKFTPGVQPSEQAVDAMGEFFKERYGGFENIKKTIATDPVGFASDLSVFMTGGAALAPKVGKIAKVAETAKTIGRAVEPLSAVKLTASGIKKLAPEQLAERIYESAGKVIRPSVKPDKRNRAIQAALSEGIVPTKAGIAKTKSLIDKYTSKVDDMIDAGVKKGGPTSTIRTDDVLTRLDDIKDYFSNDILGDNPLGDIEKISKKLKDKHPETMTVRQAQDIKRTLQKELGDAFGEHSSAKKSAGKQISRGIREELETVFPEIKTLNQKSRGLIELNEELEKAVGRISNRNLLGLTTKVLGGLGVSGQAPGASLLLALSESVLGNPRVKARLAIALSKAGKKVPSKDLLKQFKAGTARQVGFQAGRAKEIIEQ